MDSDDSQKTFCSVAENGAGGQILRRSKRKNIGQRRSSDYSYYKSCKKKRKQSSKLKKTKIKQIKEREIPKENIFFKSRKCKPSEPAKVYQNALQIEKMRSDLTSWNRLMYKHISGKRRISPEVAAHIIQQLHQIQHLCEGDPGSMQVWEKLKNQLNYIISSGNTQLRDDHSPGDTQSATQYGTPLPRNIHSLGDTQSVTQYGTTHPRNIHSLGDTQTVIPLGGHYSSSGGHSSAQQGTPSTFISPQPATEQQNVPTTSTANNKEYFKNGLWLSFKNLSFRNTISVNIPSCEESEIQNHDLSRSMQDLSITNVEEANESHLTIIDQEHLQQDDYFINTNSIDVIPDSQIIPSENNMQLHKQCNNKIKFPVISKTKYAIETELAEVTQDYYIQSEINTCEIQSDNVNTAEVATCEANTETLQYTELQPVQFQYSNTVIPDNTGTVTDITKDQCAPSSTLVRPASVRERDSLDWIRHISCVRVEDSREFTPIFIHSENTPRILTGSLLRDFNKW